MVHRKLFPKSGSNYLSPSEVIARLQSHFKHVEIDPQQGEAHVNTMVNQLTRMQSLTPPPATAEDIERLRTLSGQAVVVVFSDTTDSDQASLTTTVIPGEPLVFDFSLGGHEAASMSLLERCASILGYDIAGG